MPDPHMCGSPYPPYSYGNPQNDPHSHSHIYSRVHSRTHAYVPSRNVPYIPYIPSHGDSCGMPSNLMVTLLAGGPVEHIHGLDHRVLAEFPFDVQQRPLHVLLGLFAHTD